eukprot:TRINITY_DN12303_c0_g7_i1.p2 TRINITY_DN12303_c0_g7~~TRINITY_DN12303_c0_g7_i1.p2  ORF type:complete len:110 (+),score=16.97 TRINITY_DN12303_c0_g7_i1:847-1176(+)
MLLFSGFLFFTAGITRTYFSTTVQSLFKSLLLLNFWLSIVFAFSSLVKEINSKDNVELLFAGCGLIILATILERNKDWEDCLCGNKAIRTEQDVLRKLLTFVDIAVKNS